MAEIFYGSLQAVALFFRGNPVWGWFFILLGSVLAGSFLGVLYARLPSGRKVFILSPCECSSCFTVLRWRDIIPCLSYFFRKGKCLYCGARISPAILILEAGTVAIVSLTYFIYGPSVLFVIYSYLFLSLLLLSVIDLEFHIVPNEVTLKGIAFGMLFAVCFPASLGTHIHLYALAQSALGFLFGVFLLGTVRFLGDLLLKQEVLGFGDIALMGMIGAFLGLKLAVVCFFISPFLAIPFIAVHWLLKRGNLIAYGPALSVSAVLSLYFGDTIILFLQRMVV